MRTPTFRPAATIGTILAVIAWLLALVPTGLALHDLASFCALGAMLWLSFGSASHVFARRDWPWRSVLRSALLGAGILPPIVAVLVAMAGIERPQQLLSLFIYGAWITMGAGAVTGALSRADRPPRHGFVRRSAAAVRERVLRRRGLRPPWKAAGARAGAPHAAPAPPPSAPARGEPLSRVPADTPGLPPR